MAALLMTALAGTTSTEATEGPILRALESFFQEPSWNKRAEIAKSIEAMPGYQRAKVGEWLHRLDLYPRHAGGQRELRVPVGWGQERHVLLRLPRGYKPDKAWPMIYLLHPSGSTGPSFLGYIEDVLGPKVDEYVIAAPSYYRQTGLDAPAPFTVDHLCIFEAVRREVHIDSDRTFVVGYSTGGYAAWAVALFHADQLAGSVPIGSTFTVPTAEDGIWKAFLPNFQHVPILHVWGAKDSIPVIAFPGGGPSIGGIGDINERFNEWTRGLKLPIDDVRFPNKGHGGLTPPADKLAKLLGRERVHYPKQVDHTYRHLHQGHAYWLEATRWDGDRWGEQFPRYQAKPGESQAVAMGKAVLERMARLQGEVKGQALSVTTKNVGELTVWFGDGLVDWQQPVQVVVNGKKVFDGKLEPSLLVALSQAARTYDFDRLRWHGLQVEVPQGSSKPFPPYRDDAPPPVRSALGGNRPAPQPRRGGGGGGGSFGGGGGKKPAPRGNAAKGKKGWW